MIHLLRGICRAMPQAVFRRIARDLADRTTPREFFEALSNAEFHDLLDRRYDRLAEKVRQVSQRTSQRT